MKRSGFLALSGGLVAVSRTAASAQMAAPTPPMLPLQRGLTFQLHAAFFSRETNASPPIDPQVFVVDDRVTKGGTGPQGIEYIAGVRPMRFNIEPDVPLVNAEGSPLLFTVSRWIAATGSASIADAEGVSQDITVRFSHLIGFGVYSLFKNTFSAAGVVFTPLDGEGTHNTFKADEAGNGTFALNTPDRLTNRNAILLVYHSDGMDHGSQRGKIGYDAHHHLIASLA